MLHYLYSLSNWSHSQKVIRKASLTEEPWRFLQSFVFSMLLLLPRYLLLALMLTEPPTISGKVSVEEQGNYLEPNDRNIELNGLNFVNCHPKITFLSKIQRTGKIPLGSGSLNL